MSRPASVEDPVVKLQRRAKSETVADSKSRSPKTETLNFTKSLSIQRHRLPRLGLSESLCKRRGLMVRSGLLWAGEDHVCD